jgi:hypothetical protein
VAAASAPVTLRGSSEFHAWGDSNLYLRRDGDDLSLSVEHRAAPSMTPITIELAQRGTALALEVVDRIIKSMGIGPIGLIGAWLPVTRAAGRCP